MSISLFFSVTLVASLNRTVTVSPCRAARPVSDCPLVVQSLSFQASKNLAQLVAIYYTHVQYFYVGFLQAFFQHEMGRFYRAERRGQESGR